MRLVVKVGSSTLTHKTGKMNLDRFEALCRVLCDLANAGHEVVLVSSGAIAMGVSKLRLNERPSDIPTKQAAASVGQSELMYMYDKFFSEYGHTVAQILITGDDFSHVDRLCNFKNTVNRLLSLSAIPIVNENDTVSTDEIKVGDNDTLSALVAVNVGADLLVLLSDIDGLYTADPRKDENAVLISHISEITEEVESLGGGAGSSVGTGGMKTKLIAAKIVMNESRCRMVITNGERPADLYRIVNGEAVGTLFERK